MSENERPVGKPLRGNSGQLRRDPFWLTWEDLPLDRDTEVTIEEVKEYRNVKFEGGRVEPKMGGVHFVGKQRVLGLNATNRKTLARMFTSDFGAWIGKKISLYVASTKLKGQEVNCVRIRDRGSRAARDTEQFLEGQTERPETRRTQAQAAGSGPSAPAAPSATVTREQLENIAIDLGIAPDELTRIIAKHSFDLAAALAELQAFERREIEGQPKEMGGARTELFGS